MSAPEITVLVVDDRRNMLRLMTKVLRRDARVLTADRGREAIARLQSEPIDVVLCDLKMPDLSGLEVLEACKRSRPRAAFVLMTAHATVDTAVEALRLGAYDYLTKPFDPEEARAVVLRAAGRAAGERGEGDAVAGEAEAGDEVLPGVIGRSPAMRELGRVVRQVAASEVTAMLLGETGAGKERIARAIHQLSARRGERFVAVNCAAIPAELMESELFGVARGAFTGAARDRAGLFEEADGGTLFLDEIGELRLPLQAKLTRVLEERAVRRLGESRERPIDVRLVAATHRDLEQEVKAGRFREDLWYRLNVALLSIPPLRARAEDIELLASHFLRALPRPEGRPILGLTPAALEALLAYGWPGNVRQLKSAIERGAALGLGDRLEVGDLPPELLREVSEGGEWLSDRSWADLSWAEAQKRGREEAGRRYLSAVLERFDGRVAEAAEHAGVERESFYRLLRRHGLRPEAYRDEGSGDAAEHAGEGGPGERGR